VDNDVTHDLHPSEGESVDILARLQACLQHLEHVLPAQAPLRDFVHHNTLHGFQHLPFAQALAEAGRLIGATPWLPEARCRALFSEGRINVADLNAALLQLPDADAGRVLVSGTTREICRGDVLRAALRHPLGDITLITPVGLRWQIEERAAFDRLQADVDEDVRQRLLAAAAAGGLVPEAAVVADLWAAACEVLESGAPAANPRDAVSHLFDDFWEEERRVVPPWEKEAAKLWQGMVARLGSDWTLGALLAQLTGEDVRQALRPTLIRHLAAHLDQGLAAWRNPAREQGFFAAWRLSAGLDLSWGLDDLPNARGEIDCLPADPLQVIAEELGRLGPDESHWCAYVERLALELPGWSGMFLQRQLRAGKPGLSQAGEPPVAMLDYLAVRLVLERLYAEHLVNRVWKLPLLLSELGDYFLCHPAELWVRHACAGGQLPEDLQDVVGPRMGASASEKIDEWEHFAQRLSSGQGTREAAAKASGVAAWPLFRLAQQLGLCGRELREIGHAGASALLQTLASFDVDQRGHAWLLAYEHHYRQQIFSALAANHDRSLNYAKHSSRRIAAQMVFCMDDREEGARRHIEEFNPAVETFGAAGFFGVPILWQGLDDASPSALCPIIVRPQNALYEQVAPGTETAQAIHQRRRGWLLTWRERLHQGSRRGLLQSPLLTTLAAPFALAGLLLRTLAPARLAALQGSLLGAFDPSVPGALALTADPAEAARTASADAPRVGFSELEQVERVNGFLRAIGLTANFAPLVVIVGHGSNSPNNPHLAAYDCGACSGRHGGANARVFAALANRPEVRALLAVRGIVITPSTWFVGAEHNTCDEAVDWYDSDSDAVPQSHRQALADLRRDTTEALRLYAVERCRRFASAPRKPSPEKGLRHLVNRRHDIAQPRPELGHATIAAAFIGRRAMSRGVFFDRRVFLISYDPVQDADGRILEATLLTAGPVGAGISLEYYFSTVDNEGFGCGTKIMHNLAGLLGVMEGANSDLRTGLPQQMIEIHEAMRLLVVVEQTTDVLSALYQRQPALQELIGNGWIVLAAKHPESAEIQLFDPAQGWQVWSESGADPDDTTQQPLAEVERSLDWFSGQSEPLPPVLLRRPLAVGP
jgi:uncharacterized protein YbcC (UPF0753/DUF2309 family)